MEKSGSSSHSDGAKVDVVLAVQEGEAFVEWDIGEEVEDRGLPLPVESVVVVLPGELDGDGPVANALCHCDCDGEYRTDVRIVTRQAGLPGLKALWN
jgi:hypothetical protein